MSTPLSADALSVNSLPSVVIIDDEADILLLLSEFLSQAGFSCETFNHPVPALEYLQQKQPDVVITDMSMPVLTGAEILSEIKKINPETPVIYLSGYLSKESLMHGIDHGLFGAIEKPFEYNTVLSYVQQAARYHQSIKRLNRSVHALAQHLLDLEPFLKEHGKFDSIQVIQSELSLLVEQRRTLSETVIKKIISDHSSANHENLTTN